MKKYKNLWDEFISPENFDLAARRAVRGKKNHSAVTKFLANRQENLAQLRHAVECGEFKTSEYRIMRVYEPKKRDIYVLPLYPDHVLHHALINVLGPIWQSMFIRDSYACIPGRGLRAASSRIMHFVRKNQFVLQCDIRKFYPSINHDIMMDIIKHKIGDRRLVRVLDEVVRSVGGDKNLPIGNLTSQWMGNVYLNELDMFVKHKLRWRPYIRYCDDFCLFGNNRRELHKVSALLADFLWDKLRLQFSKCTVRPTRCGVSYIGYRHFPKFLMLRRAGARRIRRRMMVIAMRNDTSYHAEAQIQSAHGWMMWACTYNLRMKIKNETGIVV